MRSSPSPSPVGAAFPGEFNMRQGRWEVGLGGWCSVGAAGQRHMCAELYVAESDGEVRSEMEGARSVGQGEAWFFALSSTIVYAPCSKRAGTRSR